MRRDRLLLGEQAPQRPILLLRLTAKVADKITRLVATERRGEAHHHGFRHDEAVRGIEVCPHAVRMHLKTLKDKHGLIERKQ